MSPPTPANPAAVWWADDLALSDGAAVSSWTDRVNGRTVSQAASGNRPLFRAAGLNGRPSVQFDGVNDYLGLSAANAVSNASSGCVVAVAIPLSPSANGQTIWCSSDIATIDWRLAGATLNGRLSVLQKQVVTSGDPDDVMLGNTPLTTSPRAFEWSSNGSSYAMRINNSAEPFTVFSGANSGDWFSKTLNRDNFTIGALLRTTLYTPTFAGHVAYLGVFDSPLSAGDRADLYDWINSYYFSRKRGWSVGLSMNGKGWSVS